MLLVWMFLTGLRVFGIRVLGVCGFAQRSVSRRDRCEYYKQKDNPPYGYSGGGCFEQIPATGRWWILILACGLLVKAFS